MAGENDISGKVGLDYANFKQGIAALSQQIKNIEVSFRGSASVMDDWSSTSEGLNLRISSLNEKLVLQKSKLKALTDEFNLLSNSEGDHTKEQEQLAGQMASLERQIGSTQGEIKKYSTALDQAEGNADEAGNEVEEFGDEAEDAGKKTSVFGDILKANFVTEIVKQGIHALSSAIKSLASGLLDAATSSAAYADDVATLATQTGLSTDTIQEMRYAAELLDVDLETQTKGLAKVVKAIGSATGAGESYIEISDGVSVALYDSNGQLRSSEQIYYDAIDALGSLTNSTEQETAAQELFGRAYQDIMPLIAAGSKGLEAFAAAAESSGYVLSGTALESLNNYKDSMDRLSNQKEAFTNALGAAMAPAMQVFTDAATDASAALTKLVNGSIGAEEFAEEIAGLVTSLTDEINANLPALMEVAGSILSAIGNGIIAALPALATAATGIVIQLGNSIVSNLPALVMAATQILSMLGDAVIKNLPMLTKAALSIILQLADGIADSLPKLIPTIVDTLLMIVETLIDNVDLLVDASIEIIIALAAGLISALPILIAKVPEIIIKIVETLIKNIPKIFSAGQTILNNLSSGIMSVINNLLSPAREIISKIIAGISGRLSDVLNIGRSIIQKVRDGIASLNPLQWGQDLIANFAQGIRNAIGKVTSAVSNVASKVKSYLHFSEPDEGPLSDFHTYMPDMMEGLSSGIYANIGKLKTAANDAAAAISAGFHGPSARGYYSSTTENTYYGAAQEVTVLQVGDEVVTSTVKNRLSRSIQNDGMSIRRALGYAN